MKRRKLIYIKLPDGIVTKLKVEGVLILEKDL